MAKKKTETVDSARMQAIYVSIPHELYLRIKARINKALMAGEEMRQADVVADALRAYLK